jgi:hypothetical protein
LQALKIPALKGIESYWYLRLNINKTNMALLSPKYLNSVVAIGKDDGLGNVLWMGTGFLFGYRLPKEVYEENVYSVYLVSNKHVLKDLDYVYLRFNPQDNKPAQNYRLDINRGAINICKFHQNDNIDVAVVGVPQDYLDNLITSGVDPQFFTFDRESYTINDLKSLEVTEGEGVFALGYPMGNVGNTRQYVILRGGVIARIHDMLDGYSSDYIIDAPVFPGNSGGPVIIRPEITCIEGTKHQNSSRLIGLVKSYITYKDIAISPQTGRARVVFEENTGLTNVEPVDYIIQTILQQ